MPLYVISMVCALFVLLSNRLLRKIFIKSYGAVYNFIVVCLTLIGHNVFSSGHARLRKKLWKLLEILVQEMCVS